MQKVRWGILGAARINERLLPAIIASRHSELIAIASRRAGAAMETLKQFAPEGHKASCHDSLEALIEHPNIDALYIPLANAEHAEWALKAISAGKHVLCEKPLALEPEDIQAIQAAAQRHGVKVMEGFMYRFHPQHQRVKSLLESGLIGEIRAVQTHFSFMMKPARLYRVSSNIAAGSGAMWDIGCYAIHAARMWIPRKAISVSAMMHLNETGADLSCSGLIDFGEGLRALFDFGFDRTRRSEYEITGTLGTLRCPTVWQLPGDRPEIAWRTENGQSQIESPEPFDHFVLEIDAFCEAILNDRPVPLDLEDALENCRVINAAIESARTGCQVTVHRENLS